MRVPHVLAALLFSSVVSTQTATTFDSIPTVSTDIISSITTTATLMSTQTVEVATTIVSTAWMVVNETGMLTDACSPASTALPALGSLSHPDQRIGNVYCDFDNLLFAGCPGGANQTVIIRLTGHNARSCQVEWPEKLGNSTVRISTVAASITSTSTTLSTSTISKKA